MSSMKSVHGQAVDILASEGWDGMTSTDAVDVLHCSGFYVPDILDLTAALEEADEIRFGGFGFVAPRHINRHAGAAR